MSSLPMSLKSWMKNSCSPSLAKLSICQIDMFFCPCRHYRVKRRQLPSLGLQYRQYFRNTTRP